MLLVVVAAAGNCAMLARAHVQCARCAMTTPVTAVLSALLIGFIFGTNGQGLLPPKPGDATRGASLSSRALSAYRLKARDFARNWRARPRSACSATSGSLCSSATDAYEQYAQLMLAVAPPAYASNDPDSTGGLRIVPAAQNQGGCATCTAFVAVAAAQAAVASVMGTDANQVAMSPYDLYFCGQSASSRGCRSGWQLRAAIQELAVRLPRQPDCLPPSTTVLPGQQPSCDGCSIVNELAAQGTFQSIPVKDVWEAQMYIRQYGGVATSFDVLTDFRPFYRSFANKGKVYKPTGNATLEERHAVVLVGYNNDEGYWLILNSWGPDWADNGLFRAAYGCCGILDEGFAVSWAPRDGVGMPLAVAPAPKRGCFYYKARPGDDLGKISLRSNIPLDKLLLDNVDQLPEVDGPLAGKLLQLCNPPRLDMLQIAGRPRSRRGGTAANTTAPEPGRAEFLGCITDEIGLLNRFYFGGETPAFYDRSIAMALNRQMPLVAMARTGDLAYGFTAMSLSVTERPDPTLPGCNQPCRDNQAKSCGSGDGFGGVKAPRVWAVYRMQGINASSLPPTQFMGCVTNDTGFVSKQPFWDYDPAHYSSLVRQALSAEVPFVAVARRNTTADGFTFSRLTATPSVDIPGCVTPCLDTDTQSCGRLQGPDRANNTRRVWAVYRLLAGVPTVPVPPKFLGCVTDESLFQYRIYFGDMGPTSYDISIRTARINRGNYVAMARTGIYGYGFVFRRLSRPSELTRDIRGCLGECVDDRTKACGSGDGFAGARASRVWAVYSLPSAGGGSTGNQ